MGARTYGGWEDLNVKLQTVKKNKKKRQLVLMTGQGYKLLGGVRGQRTLGSR